MNNRFKILSVLLFALLIGCNQSESLDISLPDSTLKPLPNNEVANSTLPKKEQSEDYSNRVSIVNLEKNTNTIDNEYLTETAASHYKSENGLSPLNTESLLSELAADFAQALQAGSNSRQNLQDLIALSNNTKYSDQQFIYFSAIIDNLIADEPTGLNRNLDSIFKAWSNNKNLSNLNERLLSPTMSLIIPEKFDIDSISETVEVWAMSAPTEGGQKIQLYSNLGNRLELDTNSKEPKFPFIILASANLIE